QSRHSFHALPLNPSCRTGRSARCSTRDKRNTLPLDFRHPERMLDNMPRTVIIVLTQALAPDRLSYCRRNVLAAPPRTISQGAPGHDHDDEHPSLTPRGTHRGDSYPDLSVLHHLL